MVDEGIAEQDERREGERERVGERTIGDFSAMAGATHMVSRERRV